MTYEALADVYDRFTDDFDYDAWTNWYRMLIGRVAPQAREICDCGCGTGSIAVRLAKMGYHITGIDLSEDMLRVASDKARAWGVNIRWARQNMCQLALPRPVDALICACDGVNYLTEEAAVGRFFAAAFRAVKPGGAFAFDISNREKLAEMARQGLYGEDRENETYLWMNEMDEEKRLLHMQLAIFVREKDGRFRKFEETHVQRAHGVNELATLLTQAGFTDVEIMGGDEGVSPGPGGKRAYILCKRP